MKPGPAVFHRTKNVDKFDRRGGLAVQKLSLGETEWIYLTITKSVCQLLAPYGALRRKEIFRPWSPTFQSN